MTFEVIVVPKPGACDPQAEAVSAAMQDGGFASCRAASVGRYLLLEVVAADPEAATARAHEVCRAMLVNPNLESYALRLLSPVAAAQTAAAEVR